MESLDLNTLATSLPTANLANAEKDLLNNFKAAALSITTLYRSSRQTSKRAYNAGYAAACQDFLLMIQQGVSVGEPGDGGMTIGRVMDWIEARLDAVKSREEEEEEDEERDRERGAANKASGTTAKSASKPPAPAAPAPKPKEQPTASSSTLPARATPIASDRSSVSPGPPAPRPSASARSKSRVPAADISQDSGFSSPPPSPPVADVAVGAKRRHAVMMMLDSNAAPVPISIDGSTVGPSQNPGGGSRSTMGPPGGSRRRTRSTRMGARERVEEAMDVEDDGRERKRVARR